MPLKKRFAALPRQVTGILIGKLLIVVVSLLIVIGIGIGASATHVSATPGSTTPLNSPTTEQDTVQYATIHDTPVAGAQVVTVALAEYTIVSSLKVFHVGVPYYFIVTNRGQQVHEFMIMPVKPDGSLLPPDVQYNDKLIEIEQVGPGTTVYINFMFKPASEGSYQIACMMRGHYQAGMKFSIIVTR